ncbi:DUF3127 domain-containing protein [Flavobacterium arcticum]|uniref:DUF3127 domain-containing protein n=1 Tax=Flavobacterium arcticum TaxID=1784713 RepID=A0A345HBK2_9FLAO|nr:DUF3127 domain-containing protein [Flavobacterium arcticum]AXG73962.1 DUF3127 domain-containing protein [Flavobacterium arcticum]KAF2508938.1 DUF3127 domain-containing protein [Flavobacterium arcticum]
MKISGNIESIEYRNTAGHEKKVVTIAPGFRQKAFVEFRGRRMADLDAFKENDEIEVTVTLEGKTSKNSGIQYNNLVAQEVTQTGSALMQ